MVADNKKQPASESPVVASVTPVKSGGESSRKLSLPKISKKLVALIIVIVLLIAAFFHYGLHVGEKVYAQAAGHKIYKKEVKDLIGNTKGVSDRDAATALANKYLTEAMAKDVNVTVTNKDLVGQYGPSINTEKTQDKYAYQVDVNNAYFNRLIAYNNGYYKGKLIVANFSGHIAYQSPFLAIQQARDPNVGNPAVVAADKKYAQDFINNIYSQLKSGKITFDQAMQKEYDDPHIGRQAYQTISHSGDFDTSNASFGTNALIAPTSIKQKIASMKAGQTSAPFVVTVSNSFTDDKVTTESYYLIVQMDSTKGGNSGLTYPQYLKQSKERLGYKVNV